MKNSEYVKSYAVEPMEVTKTWRKRDVNVEKEQVLRTSLNRLGIKHCIVMNDWNLTVYVPGKNYYDMISVLDKI